MTQKDTNNDKKKQCCFEKISIIKMWLVSLNQLSDEVKYFS